MLNGVNNTLNKFNNSINTFRYNVYISRLKMPIRSIINYINTYEEELKDTRIEAPTSDPDIQARLDRFINSNINEYEQMIKDESVKYYKKPIGDMSFESIKLLSEKSLSFLDGYALESLMQNESFDKIDIETKIQSDLNIFIQATIEDIRNKS